MNGYAGNILKADLSSGEISSIPTKKYESWVGGHGMGSAIFWEYVKDKSINGFDPANVVTIMTSPLCGTLAPAASARTEVQGIGVQSYPIGWFTRSNFGGRFSSMLKFAGWDGIIIQGKAPKPVWIDIRNDKVVIKEAGRLWGMDTVKTQQTIWSEVMEGGDFRTWMKLGPADGERTTQKPAVLTIGPAGENLSRMACLIHDAGNAAGQGGFGAVWGSKNLKAISVIGTGDIKVHDAKALMAARLWQKKNYAFDLKNLKRISSGNEFHNPPLPVLLWGFPAGSWRPQQGQRPQACVGCHSGCRARFQDGLANEASCIATAFYMGCRSMEIQRKTTDLVNRYGLNAHEMLFCLIYLNALRMRGILGPGKAIDCPLDFKTYGGLPFVEQFVRMVAYRDDGNGKSHAFGEAIAEGTVRAAKHWGRLDTDLTSGLLPFPFWGLPVHKEPVGQLEWGYGTLLGDRDISEHDFDTMKWDATSHLMSGSEPQVSAEELVRIYTDKMVPFEGDRLMLDYSAENMYSEHIAKLVSWHRYYTRFWKQSAMFCDFRWPDFLNQYAPGRIGSTGLAEPKFLNAVTGKNLTFRDGMELGQKIWNLDHAIWTLQGRHRDMVHFAEYIYRNKSVGVEAPVLGLTGRKNGKWVYFNALGRRMSKSKFEEFKTRFYKLQGWDPESGFPKTSTLQALGLSRVADELEQNQKLGKENKGN